MLKENYINLYFNKFFSIFFHHLKFHIYHIFSASTIHYIMNNNTRILIKDIPQHAYGISNVVCFFFAKKKFLQKKNKNVKKNIWNHRRTYVSSYNLILCLYIIRLCLAVITFVHVCDSMKCHRRISRVSEWYVPKLEMLIRTSYSLIHK